MKPSVLIARPRAVEEQVAVVDWRADVQPLIEDRFRFLPQRQFAIAPPLAQDADGLELGTGQAVERECDQFRYPQAGGLAQVQHRAVAQTCHCPGIRGIQDGLHFGFIQPVDKGLVGALLRDGTHLQCEVEAARDTIFQVPEEGLDGSEAVIAGAHAVVCGFSPGIRGRPPGAPP